MRKVKFKAWIQKQYLNGDNKYSVVGTNCFQPDFETDGLFHQWGLSMEDTGKTVASYSIALIETADGKISEVLPSHFKFIS